MRPTISVIIPAFNAEKTILETLNSVKEQTFSDFEVIVINDGSTDKTLELVKAINDQRFKVFSYENGGLSTARNRGIALAKGEYIAFLDADDLWTSDKLELQLKALRADPDAGVAYSWTYFMNEEGTAYHTGSPMYFEGQVSEDLLKWNFIASGSNPLIKKEAIDSIGEFDCSMAGVADWDYWIRLASKWSYVLVPKEQVYYRQSSGSMSSKVEYMEECSFKAIEKHFNHNIHQKYPLEKYKSYTYRYSSKLYLEKDISSRGIQRSYQKLVNSVRAYPKSLLERETQKLIVKLILLKMIPMKISRYILEEVNKKKITKI